MILVPSGIMTAAFSIERTSAITRRSATL